MSALGAEGAQNLARALERLPGIQTVEVLSGPSGIEEVNVLVSPQQNTGETISDVFATAAISLDSELDPSRVKVLTAPEMPVARHRTGPRSRLASLALSHGEKDFVANVSLTRAEETLIGEHRSMQGSSLERRSVAEATLEAASPLLRSHLDVTDVDVITVGATRIAVVLLAKGEDTLVGSALVRVDEHDAIARSTLDALNRLISDAVSAA